MVLISQIQRSGGHLVNSLLDGHPQLHVHPWEIQIGHPSKSEWPRVDLRADPDSWLQILRQPWIPGAFEKGYRSRLTEEFIPVTIVPSFVDGLFRVLVADDPPTTQRDVLDRYFTAFFNAWLDCQGLRDSPKRWLVGFCPRLAWGDSWRRWRADYPDGRLVSVLRDPRGWYASARPHKQHYRDLDSALAHWRRGAEEIAAAKRESPSQVFVLTYEGLVRKPEEVTSALAAWLGIEWAPSLLNPTFNRHPAPPNSTVNLPASGIRTESLNRWLDELDEVERSRIEEHELPLYEEVSELADTRGR